MALQAGDLNKRITLLCPFFETSETGQRVKMWRETCKLWAQIQSVDNKTATGDGTIVHNSEYKFYVRRRKGITDEMRISWDGRTFELTGAPLDWQSDQRWLTLVCREVR